ncbi:DUF1292 domain-containing protein [Paenibacillus motobuensis]|jgi:uncharacterized protein YrzB (UPF0473 family)|uniref:DUF1292 domain-containing protein n=1 Tax=Paenibacillus motobuensis TaxID=295324 RepID=A0ABN0Y3B1_9BACL
MTDFSAEKVVWTSRVRDAYGTIVELQDEQGKASYYTVENEFDVAGASYAALRPEQDSSVEEPELFKIVQSSDGELELVTIEDDDEWENVSELYGELTFPE